MGLPPRWPEIYQATRCRRIVWMPQRANDAPAMVLTSEDFYLAKSAHMDEVPGRNSSQYDLLDEPERNGS